MKFDALSSMRQILEQALNSPNDADRTVARFVNRRADEGGHAALQTAAHDLHEACCRIFQELVRKGRPPLIRAGDESFWSFAEFWEHHDPLTAGRLTERLLTEMYFTDGREYATANAERLALEVAQYVAQKFELEGVEFPPDVYEGLKHYGIFRRPCT